MPGDKGRIVEPGHQFEWAWLLLRWAERRGNADGLVKARRLFEIGEQYGIAQPRDVSVMTLLDDFSVADPIARLWPQTEWLKSAIRFAALTQGEERERYLRSAVRAATALQSFLDTPVEGLWRDKQEGRWGFRRRTGPRQQFLSYPMRHLRIGRLPEAIVSPSNGECFSCGPLRIEAGRAV